MKNVIIYGAASMGKVIFKKIHPEYNVVGFIDKRASEIGFFEDLPVWNIYDDIPYKNVLILIAVKNVFSHEEIAYQLFCAGYEYIVYKPIKCIDGTPTEIEVRINEIYENILRIGNIPFEGIPSYAPCIDRTLFDKALIGVNEQEEVIAYIPIESVFTNILYSENGAIISHGKNILTMVNRIELFQFFMGEQGVTYDNYLDECIDYANIHGIKVTDAWKTNVLDNRYITFLKMNKAFELDRDFFVRNAIDAKWNKGKSYFNLSSGKHRAAFLLARGSRYIPLKISKSDYDIFLNKECAKELKEYLIDNNIHQVSFPISHPNFYDCVCKNEDYNYKMLILVSKILSKASNNKEITCIDLSGDHLFLLHYLQRCGAEIATLNEYKDFKLNHLIEELLFQHSPKYYKKTEIMQFDMMFANLDGLEKKSLEFYNSLFVFITSINQIDCSLYCGYHVHEGYQCFFRGNIVYIYLLIREDEYNAIWK